MTLGAHAAVGRTGLLTTALVALLLACVLIPVFWMFLVSLAREGSVTDGLRGLLAGGLTFGNYRDVWEAGPFPRYVLNSVIVAVIVVAGNVVLGAMAGYGLARWQGRGKKLLLISVVAVLMLPRQVTMIPIYIMMSWFGLIDTYGALTLPFLVDPFSVFLVTQYVLSLPRDLEDAARVDGAGELSVFFRVVMPLAKPVLAVVAINTFVINWNSFLYPLILTSSQSMRTLPVGLALYSQGEHSVDWGHLMAGSSLAALPVALVFLVFQRQIIKGITSGWSR
jgi:multiple sugar transport system permease protein